MTLYEGIDGWRGVLNAPGARPISEIIAAVHAAAAYDAVHNEDGTVPAPTRRSLTATINRHAKGIRGASVNAIVDAILEKEAFTESLVDAIAYARDLYAGPHDAASVYLKLKEAYGIGRNGPVVRETLSQCFPPGTYLNRMDGLIVADGAVAIRGSKCDRVLHPDEVTGAFKSGIASFVPFRLRDPLQSQLTGTADAIGVPGRSRAPADAAQDEFLFS